MNNLLQLEQKYYSLINSEFKNFQDIAVLKNIMGVYIIYSDDQSILYIGSTNKFNVRFGTDLKHESTHTLMNKVLKDGRFSDRKSALAFLKEACKFRIEECATKREAEALEHFSIWSLNPYYNK